MSQRMDPASVNFRVMYRHGGGGGREGLGLSLEHVSAKIYTFKKNDNKKEKQMTIGIFIGVTQVKQQIKPLFHTNKKI